MSGACLAVALWLSLGTAGAQVPDIPVPREPGTVPTTPPPAEGEPPAVPGPTQPPAPTDSLPPGTPGTPVSPAPTPTTTTMPAGKQAASAIPPGRSIEGAAPARFSLDLSEIDALRRQARGKGPRAPEPDFGFDSDLPFQPGAEAGETAEEEALELGAEAEAIARVRSAAAVAAGLLALLLVGFAVWTLRQARPTQGRPGPLE